MVTINSSQLSLSTLRILRADGQTVGTGFLVAPDLAVTCAHVVTDAEAIEGDTLQVQFTGQTRRLSARVEPDLWRDIPRGDVAFLRFAAIPAGIEPVRLGLAAQSPSGSPFYAFGYASAAQVQGIAARGSLIALLPGSGYLQIRAHEANHGMSGAPVLDETRGVVVGMITKGQIEAGRNAETTFATPCERLFEICPQIGPSEVCPYLGLEAFSAATSRFFFGREALTEKLVLTLRGGCRFLAVFGPSGSGKSSLVRAGLLPRLATGIFSGWQQVIIRPADNPLGQLRAAGLDLSFRAERARVVLLIDQFEELFTLCPPPLREKFLQRLELALQNPNLVLIIAMRDDFYSAFNAQAARLAASEHLRVENIPNTLTHADLLTMMTGPAQQTGLSLEEGLAAAILKDLAPGSEARSSVLPLLEFTLTQLWHRRENGQLTHAAYQAIGGVSGGLARWADAAYAALPREGQQIAQSLLTSLVHPGDEAQGLPDTRRRRALNEFDPPALDVIRHFNAPQWRLLILADGKVELIHDSLVREWGRLHDWLRKDRAQLRFLETVREASAAWAARPRDPDLLVHHGGRLEDALKLQAHLSPPERAYLSACKTSEQRRRRSLVGGIAVAALLLFSVVLGWGWSSSDNAQTMQKQAATSDALRVVAVNQAGIARSRELAAQANAVRENDPQRALLLGVEAAQWSGGHPAWAEQVLRDSLAQVGGLPLPRQEAALTRVAFSPDGNWLAAGGADGAVRLWAVSSLAAPQAVFASALMGNVVDLAFVPDARLNRNRWLLSVVMEPKKSYKTIQLWDLQNFNAPPIRLQGPQGAQVYHHALSSDGRWLALDAATLDSVAFQVWDLQNPAVPVASFGPEADLRVDALALSPDGNRLGLVSSSENNVIVQWWDLKKTTAPPARWDGPAAPPTQTRSLAFSPALAGEAWLAVGLGGEVYLWNLKNPPGAPLVLKQQNGWVSRLSFSLDGAWLLVEDGDRGFGVSEHTARLVDLRNPTTAPFALSGQHSDLRSSPDGRWLASNSLDGSARLIDLQNRGAQPLQLRGHDAGINTLAFSPDGARLATGSADQTVRLWDVNHLAVEPVLLNRTSGFTELGMAAPQYSLEFSPDGQWLGRGATGMNLANLWSVQNPTVEPLVAQSRDLLFSPAGQWAALVNDSEGSSLLDLWNLSRISDGPKTLRREKSMSTALQFSSDGRWFAAGFSDQRVLVQDLRNLASAPTLLSGPQKSVRTLAFSPDARWLAAGGDDKTVRFWDLQNLTSEAISPLVHERALERLAFSPDGRWLATESVDQSVRLWDWQNPAHPVQRLDGPGGVLFGFSPDGKWLALQTRSGDPAPAIRLYSPQNLAAAPLTFTPSAGRTAAFAFSLDWKWLAIGDDNKNISLWDLQHPGSPPLLLRGHEKGVWALVFSPDGKWLASGDDNGIARLWNLKDLSARPVTLSGGDARIRAVAFSPDAQWLATGGQDGALHLWRVNLADLVALACRSAGRNFTSAEWAQYFPDEPAHITCSQWAAAP